MNLGCGVGSSEVWGFPRMRGDEPVLVVFPTPPFSFSPHTRG